MSDGIHEGAAATALEQPLPGGNHYDKYGTANPLARAMVTGFRRELDELWRAANPASQLDCGCGEGVLTQEWALRIPGRPVVGIDLEGSSLADEWAARSAANLEYRCADVTALPFEGGKFDLVSGIEMLEHAADPEAALAEMFRVAARYVLVSVPREPLWRALNLVRGAYVAQLGNTPGHVNHWSRNGFVRLVSGFGSVEAVRLPLPWTIVLLRVNGR